MSWEFTEDLSNSEPVSLGRPPDISGVYRVKIPKGTSEKYKTDSGNDRIRWGDLVMTGDYKGCEIFDGINIPNMGSEKSNAFIRRLWVNLHLALGKSKKKIQKKLKINSKAIEDIEFWIYYTTRQDTGSDFGEVKHLTEGQAQKLLKANGVPVKNVELEDDDDEDPLDALDSEENEKEDDLGEEDSDSDDNEDEDSDDPLDI